MAPKAGAAAGVLRRTVQAAVLGGQASKAACACVALHSKAGAQESAFLLNAITSPHWEAMMSKD